MRRIGGYSAAPYLRGTVDFTSLPANQMVRYVSPTGSDSNNGAVLSPYLTVGRALRDCPDHFIYTGAVGTLCIFRVVIDPAYAATVPYFELRISPRVSGLALPVLVIEGGVDIDARSAYNTTSDTRWTNIAGPFTSSAGAQYAVTRPSYTLPALSIASDGQYVGKFARIFNAGGTEVRRGVIVKTVASTQQMVIQTGSSYTATAGEIIRVCEPVVDLANGFRLQIANMGLVMSSLKQTGFGSIGTNMSSLFANMIFSQYMVEAASGVRLQVEGANADRVKLRTPSSAAGNSGTTYGYPASEDTVGGPGVICSTGSGVCYQSSISLLTGGTIIGLVSGAPASSLNPQQGGVILSSHGCLVGGFDYSAPGNAPAMPNVVYVSSGALPTTPFLLLRKSWGTSLTGPLMKLANTVVITQPGGASPPTIAVDNEASAEAVIDAISNVRMSGVAMRIDEADAAIAATASIVVNARQDSSLLISTASTQVGTGGDVKAGDNPAITYATLAARPSSRETCSNKLASVRAA